MAIRHEKQYRVSATTATTATLVPRDGERDPLSRNDPATPTQIVFTFAATPSFYTVDKIVNLEIEGK